MADAEAKVSLNSEGFVSGAEKVKRASREMAQESEKGAQLAGNSMRSFERASLEGAERVSGGTRSISMALRATTGEAGAARYGMIEFAKAAGLGTASIIGLGAGVQVVERVVTSIGDAVTRSRELGEEVARVFSGGGGLGTGSSSGLRRQIDEASAAIDKLTPGKESAIDIGARVAQNAYRAATGNPSVEEENDQRITALDNLRTRNASELANRREQEVEFSIRALRVGEENLRVEKEQLATRDRIRAITDDKAVAGEGAARMVDAEKALGAARVEAAKEEVQRVSDVYTLRKKIAEIRSPGVTTGKLGFDPAELQEFGRVKSVGTANAEFSDSLARLQTAKDKGHDTTAASAEVTDKQIALSEALRSAREERDTLAQQANIQSLQLTNQVTAAKNASALLGLQKQITAATNAGKDAEAAKYQAMLDQLKAAQQLENYLHPEGPARDRAGKRATDQASARMGAAGGLLNPVRDANGDVAGGLDPETGQNRNLSAAERSAARAASNRRARGLYDGSTKAKDAVSGGLIGDNAPIPDLPRIPDNAGTGNMFDRTSASGALDRASAARSTLEGHRGDFQHDPAARMDAAHTFRSVAGMEWDQRHGGKNVAEENRPKAPQKQEHGDKGTAELIGTMGKLMQMIQQFGTKIGSA